MHSPPPTGPPRSRRLGHGAFLPRHPEPATQCEQRQLPTPHGHRTTTLRSARKALCSPTVDALGGLSDSPQPQLRSEDRQRRRAGSVPAATARTPWEQERRAGTKPSGSCSLTTPGGPGKALGLARPQSGRAGGPPPRSRPEAWHGRGPAHRVGCGARGGQGEPPPRGSPALPRSPWRRRGSR